MGPLLIFDKSTLQSFSLDESVWLENFFITNITPLFFVESLADLEKEMGSGKTPEDTVGALASKTPVNGSFSNVHHALMRAIIHRGTTKQTPTGEISIFCIASNTRGWLASNLRIFLAGQNRLRSELLYPILLAVGNYIS